MKENKHVGWTLFSYTVHAHMYTHMHTHTHAHIHTCTHTHMHTYTHAHMYTHMHTHTHILVLHTTCTSINSSLKRICSFSRSFSFRSTSSSCFKWSICWNKPNTINTHCTCMVYSTYTVLLVHNYCLPWWLLYMSTVWRNQIQNMSCTCTIKPALNSFTPSISISCTRTTLTNSNSYRLLSLEFKFHLNDGLLLIFQSEDTGCTLKTRSSDKTLHT